MQKEMIYAENIVQLLEKYQVGACYDMLWLVPGASYDGVRASEFNDGNSGR
jgi:hypothetical protein